MLMRRTRNRLIVAVDDVSGCVDGQSAHVVQRCCRGGDAVNRQRALAIAPRRDDLPVAIDFLNLAEAADVKIAVAIEGQALRSRNVR